MITLLQSNTGEVYYPFGMTIRDLSRNGTDVIHKNEYLYNGKMHQDEMGLNLLDYGARFYDAVLGRWHSVDPLSENTPNWSPYVYCNNTPVVMIDPDGRYSKFGAWVRNVLWGGDGISKSGKEWGVQLGGAALDGSYEVVFQTKGSKHWFREDYIAAWKVNNNFARTLDQAGIEYTYTNNVNEARLSHLKAASGLLLANPLLKGTTNAVNGGSEAGNEVVQTTLHGTKRIAGASATRGGVLTQEGVIATKSMGKTITQADGATVYLHEVSPGRFNAVVEGNKGVITTMANWSQKSILQKAKRYGWKLE